MSLPRPTRFGTQIALIYGGIVLLLAAALSIAVGDRASNTARDDMAERLGLVTASAERLFADGLHEYVVVADRLAADPSLWRAGLGSSDVAAALERLKATHEDLAWAGVADLHGVVRNATGGLLVGADVTARPWFGAGLIGTHVGDVHQALMLAKLLPPTNFGEPQRFVDFSAPISVGGATVGVIALHGSWEWARRIAETVAPATRQGVELFVFDRTGAAIFAPPGATAPALETGHHVDGIVNAQATPALLRWPDDREYLTSVVRVRPGDAAADLGWFIVARVPREIADASAARAGRFVFIAGLLGALVAILVAWAVSRSISRPLTAIAQAAADLAAGKPARIPAVDNNVELERLSRALIDMTTEFEARVEVRTRALERANADLAEAARVDPLTSLLNRRGFEDRLNLAKAGAERWGQPISAIAVDVDHFKRVNDTYGHGAGDAVLTKLAAVMREHFRETDIVARLGGEEFTIVLPNTDVTGAQRAAEKLVARVALTRFADVGRVTISCGVSRFLIDEPGLGALRRADHALYRAKNEGRDRAVAIETMIGLPTEAD